MTQDKRNKENKNVGQIPGSIIYTGKKEKQEDKSQNVKTYEPVRRNLQKRDFAVSNQDIEAHKKFVTDNIKESLWEY